MQAVFGGYSAVAAADAEAVHVLAEKLPYFFRHRSWQSGAYQVCILLPVLYTVDTPACVIHSEDPACSVIKYSCLSYAPLPKGESAQLEDAKLGKSNAFTCLDADLA